MSVVYPAIATCPTLNHYPNSNPNLTLDLPLTLTVTLTLIVVPKYLATSSSDTTM